MSLNVISANLSSAKLTLPVAVFGMMLALAGCSKSSTPEESVDAETPAPSTEQEVAKDNAASADGQTVTIYSSRNEQLIKPLLDRYTEQTGVKVELVTDKDGPLMARLQAEGQNTPADMLLTVDAGNLWQAAEQGLLQPVASSVLEANVPAKYRDPEGRWTGLSLRARTIFYDPSKVSADQLSTYADLADPKWKGKLCLRTSKKVYNQSLVASMMEHLGAEKTEAVIRGWVANLATDVFSDDTNLLEAIAAGQCEVGIANSYYYGRLLDEKPDFPVKIFWANQGTTGTHVNISGAGVVTGSDNADGALKLMEWLSSDDAQGLYASADKEFPVKVGIDESEMLRSWGQFKPDDINVQKFGALQTQAIQMMDKAGYK
ncbi:MULTISPECIES: Fe(3+) ABC transporter substrate-binding protein [Psychrobacter]|uniref:Fe(3+) ABC transporter substrate-binding protein n=1 Tax=Psychrobacter TaxID=497 RepID=UPI000354BE08|nr:MULTISPECIES: Fe(3+) ABC transporter substrate-binding protein [unclassified Psychrobacter]AGP49291.1 iron deficiency-induced protein A [Psychrobacter sp. G]KAA0934961.1 Fe(3+) ABC transporter substrate-binding protein [Psychrobacter sp. ANT_H59]MBA2057547.1 Fe(3+) ABC transporter substrate-binding protein [Psychrobacter sp. D2]WAI87399.1 putative binding protein component of ABC iron transporter [Psychrobacter sp. SC65A.3]